MTLRTADRVTELELSGRQPLVLPTGTGSTRVLLRLHGCPVGFVHVDGPGTLTADALLAAAGPEVHAAVAQHRELDVAEPEAGCRRPGPWPGSDGLVSVIVATRDRPDQLELALTSVLACEGSFEVIVVDNAPSTDASRDVVRFLADPRLRYVLAAEPGLSRARNVGARAARGSVLAFTDDDVRVDPGWVVALERAFTMAPDIAVVTGMVPAAELLTAAQVFFDARVSWSNRCSPDEIRVTRGRAEPLLPYLGGNLGTGANLGVRARVLAAIGGFDEALGVGTPSRGGEDLDLFARVLLGGWAVRYEPSALVWHTHRREVADLQRQMRGYGSGLTAYLAKHALTAEGASRLSRGLARGVGRIGEQQRQAGKQDLGPALVREERLGLLEGPWRYLQGRRASALPVASSVPDPDLPVVELLDDGTELPAAAAPLLVTAHGHPLGVMPLDATASRERAAELFAHELRPHRAESAETACSWATELGDRRPGATVVITTTGDRPEGLRAVVQLVLQQTYTPLQVVVVDNRPGTWARAGSLPDSPQVRVVDERVPGISAARNAGMAVTETPIIVFLDDDVIPAPDCVGWLVAALHRSPRAVCATGLILPLETRTRGQQLLEEWGGYSKGFVPQLHRHPRPDLPHPLYPYLPGLYGSGANVGFFTEQLRAFGGYDESLGAGTPTHGGEDLAMQMRVVLEGHDLVYEPAAVLWHRHRGSLADWRRQTFRYGAGLSAAMLVRAAASPEDRREIVRRLPAAAQHALSPSSRKNFRRSGDYPRTLALLELAGMAYGPVALARSRLRLRRLRRRS